MVSVKRIIFTLLALSALSAAQSQPRTIDPERSKITVYADKAGLFSFAGHNHTVAAPIASGEVRENGEQYMTLTVNAREMKVLDPDLETEKRAEVQRDMHAKVLDSEHYPAIEFRSTKIEPHTSDGWLVIGQLTLRGQSKPVTVHVRKQGGGYTGTARFKQTEFGITPISVAAGTIKVKDELKIDFEINFK